MAETYRISRFQVKGFRRLSDVDLQMRPFTTVIGVNGSGKTSLLDAFSLLSESAAGKLPSTLVRLGGLSDILTRGKSDALELSVEVEVPADGFGTYGFRLVPMNNRYLIEAEGLRQWGGRRKSSFQHIAAGLPDDKVHYIDPEKGHLVSVDWDYNHAETALSQVPKTLRKPEEFRRILSTAVKYNAPAVGGNAPLLLPQQMWPATGPGANGEDLLPFLYNLRETDGDRYGAVVDTMKAAFPDFVELGFPPVAAGKMSMTWKDEKFSRPLYHHELSEGTLRFLWLVSLLQSPALPAVTMIDEPDASLHPELMRLLTGLMREASARTQIIAVTHSDRLVRFVEPEELLVFDLDEDGNTTANYADTFDIEEWLSDYRLDELWSMGNLKG